MPIPTEQDRREANVDMLARGISGQLRTLRFARQKDKPRMRLALRQALDNYAEVVMQAADALEERKRQHAGLVSFVGSHGGWVTSVAGLREVWIDCLPGSALPATLARIGYRLRREEPGQRVLAHAIVEEFVRNNDGSLAC